MLDPSVLRSALRPLYLQEGMPASEATAALSWTKAYASYAQSAVAGIVTLSLPLSVIPVGAPFLPALDAMVASMWASAAWVGPGATGITSPSGPISVALLANPIISLGETIDLALQRVSAALHTYTLGLTVIVTTASGATSAVPIT